FLKGEVPQDDSQPDLEAPRVGHRTLDLPAQPRNVENRTPIFVAGKFGQEFLALQLEFELVLQHVEKDQIKLEGPCRCQVVGIAALLLADSDRQEQHRSLCWSACV